METQQLVITIRYDGSDVDGGAMPIEDVIESLRGFAGAYTKTADRLFAESTHELRVAAVEKGSFELMIVAAVFIGHHKDVIEGIKTAGSAAKFVFETIRGVVESKKHVRSRPYSVAVSGNGNIVIVNADGSQLGVSKEVAGLLESRLLDSDLHKIVAPLTEGAVDKAELVARDDQEEIETSIAFSDKDSFSEPETSVTSKEAELNGTLISLNKESMRGTFKRSDGKKVPYHFIGEKDDLFFSGFSYKGLIRATGVAHFDENLDLKRFDITRVVRLQPELPLEPGPMV